MKKKDDASKKSSWGWILWVGFFLSLNVCIVFWVKENYSPPPPVKQAEAAVPAPVPTPPPLAKADVVIHAGELKIIELSDKPQIVEISPPDNPCVYFEVPTEGGWQYMAHLVFSDGHGQDDSPQTHWKTHHIPSRNRFSVTGTGSYPIQGTVGECRWQYYFLSAQ